MSFIDDEQIRSVGFQIRIRQKIYDLEGIRPKRGGIHSQRCCNRTVQFPWSGLGDGNMDNPVAGILHPVQKNVE